MNNVIATRSIIHNICLDTLFGSYLRVYAIHLHINMIHAFRTET